MVPLNTQDGVSQHPGWCLSTPRMVPLNTQDGASQNPGWCHSTPRMVPLNTQDGASQNPGWCHSTPRMVPLKTQDGTPASTQDGPSPSTSDGTRLDVGAYSFWAGRIERAFLNPILTSNQQSQLLSCYRKLENIKNGMYDQRIREVEQATFTL